MRDWNINIKYDLLCEVVSDSELVDCCTAMAASPKISKNLTQKSHVIHNYIIMTTPTNN